MATSDDELAAEWLEAARTAYLYARRDWGDESPPGDHAELFKVFARGFVDGIRHACESATARDEERREGR